MPVACKKDLARDALADRHAPTMAANSCGSLAHGVQLVKAAAHHTRIERYAGKFFQIFKFLKS